MTTKSARYQFSIRELMTGVFIVSLLCFLAASPDSAEQTQQSIKHRIRQWRPDEEATTQPDSRLLCPNMSITGAWSLKLHLTSSSLAISERATGEFEVQFCTGGCLGGIRLARTGRFEGGILCLDQPVAEYRPATYTKLYAIRWDGEAYLLPSMYVDEFLASLSSDKKRIVDDLGFRRSLFARNGSGRKQSPQATGSAQPSNTSEGPRLTPVARWYLCLVLAARHGKMPNAVLQELTRDGEKQDVDLLSPGDSRT